MQTYKILTSYGYNYKSRGNYYESQFFLSRLLSSLEDMHTI